MPEDIQGARTRYVRPTIDSRDRWPAVRRHCRSFHVSFDGILHRKVIGAFHRRLARQLAHNDIESRLVRSRSFFVISGFVISLPFAGHLLEGRPPVALGNYYLRRLTRLEPPFIICVTIFFVLFVLAKGQTFSEALPHYLATATYTHNIAYGRVSTLSPVTWSLEVEIQFYIMAPLIALVFSIHRTLVRRALIVSLIAAASALQPALEEIPFINVFDFMQFFLVGFLLSDVYVASWRRTPATSLAMDLAGLIAAMVLYVATGNHGNVDHSPLWIVCSCLGLFVRCCAAFRGTLTSRILGNPWIVVIGGMCYTIYLYHYQIFSLTGHAAMRVQIAHHPLLSFGTAFIFMVPVMLVVSSVLFVLFEKPFMRKDWPRRLAAWAWNRRDRRRGAI